MKLVVIVDHDESVRESLADAKLAAIAQRSLEKLGVEVLVGSRVDHIDRYSCNLAAQY